MPGHAVQAGSAFGGFIEGLTGTFQDISELRGRRSGVRLPCDMSPRPLESVACS